MRILVTGGAGFIGSHLVDRLIQEGHEVVVVDDLSSGKEENINPRAKFYRMDIGNSQLKEIFAQENPEIIYHLAAQVSVTKAVADPLWDAQINILGSLNLLELAHQYKINKFIYASTGGAVYGEPEYIPVDENHRIAPLSPYGVSKFIVEKYISVYSHNYGLKYTILRYPNVYGPRQEPHGEAGVVAIFSQQMLAHITPTIFGDGSKTRDYVYVEDIVEANILSLYQGDGEVFNLGWSQEITDYTIFDEVRQALGYSGEPQYESKRPGEIDNIALKAEKIREALGWSPRVSLSEGIKRTTTFYSLKMKGASIGNKD
jgi:UDP-glucose 4-epimerase